MKGPDGKPEPSINGSNKENTADYGKPVDEKNNEQVELKHLTEELEEVVVVEVVPGKSKRVFNSPKAGHPTVEIAGVESHAAVTEVKEEPEKAVVVEVVPTKSPEGFKGPNAGPSHCSPAAGHPTVEVVAKDVRNRNKPTKVGIETNDEGDQSEPESPSKKAKRGNTTCPTELRSSGIKLMDKVMSHMEKDGFMEQFEAQLVSKASEIGHATEFCSSLLHQNVIEETDVQQETGPQAQEEQQIERAIKTACSKRAVGSLILAFQNSSNERILLESYIWLESFKATKRKTSIAVHTSLERQQMPTAHAPRLFAATETGLISLNLQTFEATALTSENTFAVAVNHKLSKVYWSEGRNNSSIRRSNFDGSAKETIVPPRGNSIYMLAIDEQSGNVYFALYQSLKIESCNEHGQNCSTVLSNSSLVNFPLSLTVDSVKRLMYWVNFGFGVKSLVRANLDGSNASTISTEFTDLRGITLAQLSNEVLYWADWGERTIGTIDFNGGEKRTLVQLNGPRPYGIAADAHKIYFSNRLAKNIQCMDRKSGAELTTIFNSTGGVRHLALLTPVTM